MRRSITAILLAVPVACTGGPGDGIVIGAAASLSGLLPELTAAYARETGDSLTTTIGSSGQLAQQIRQGAPVAVFLSADVSWVDTLVADGHIVPGSRAIYARGRLALWSRDTAASLNRIEDLVENRIGRIAIANPEFAPYGRAAREALAAAGIWNALQPRIIIAENVRQALQFAETGNAGVAFVAHTLVRDAGGHTVVVPGTLHAPLDQALGIVAGTDVELAGRFTAFVLEGGGRAVLERHGFTLPESR